MTQPESPSPTVLITGAAKRIGRAIATDLAAHGFAIAIHCNTSRADAEALAQQIISTGGRAHVVQVDLADSVCLPAMVDEAARALGPVRMLVNNASLFETDSFVDMTQEQYARQMAVNLTAPLVLAQRFAARLPAGLDGLVVNLIDQRVLKPTPQHFSYTLSKSALWAATRTMAQALAPRIRVNAIGPGPTLPNPRQHGDEFARQSGAILLGQGPDLGEFGAAVRFLWTARSITGQMIALDGGQHLAWQTPDALADA